MTTIVDNKISKSSEIEKILDVAGCPKSAEEIGVDPTIVPTTLKVTKDIRDKYILSRLLLDIGLLDEYADTLN